jgi:hypothetical protein
MVSPADVPASYDFNSLICPSRTKAAFEHKRQFPELSSPRRFPFELPRYMRPKPILRAAGSDFHDDPIPKWER